MKFGDFAAHCGDRACLDVPRRRANALNIEIGTPMPRCKQLSPDGRGLAWLWSGGSVLAYGCCTRDTCPRLTALQEEAETMIGWIYEGQKREPAKAPTLTTINMHSFERDPTKVEIELDHELRTIRVKFYARGALACAHELMAFILRSELTTTWVSLLDSTSYYVAKHTATVTGTHNDSDANGKAEIRIEKLANVKDTALVLAGYFGNVFQEVL